MIEIQSYRNEVPNILHFQGKSKNHFKSVIMNIIKEGIIGEVPEDLTIITCFTDRNDSLLAECLERNHIPYVNAFTGNPEDKWEMPNKIMYYNQALERVTTKYVMLLDGNDVVVQNFNNFIEKFEATGLDICFNATRNNHPKVLVDLIHDRDWRGEFRYLNAGCLIGKTEAVKDFYKKAERLIFQIQNPWNSEQLVIRHVFKDCDLKKVDFDWKCEMFQTMSESIILFVRTDENAYITKDIYQVL